jgi:hypothetical protein
LKMKSGDQTTTLFRKLGKYLEHWGHKESILKGNSYSYVGGASESINVGAKVALTFGVNVTANSLLNETLNIGHNLTANIGLNNTVNVLSNSLANIGPTVAIKSSPATEINTSTMKLTANAIDTGITKTYLATTMLLI